MKAAIFFFLGLVVFPSLYKLRGAWKVYVDTFATFGSICSIGYGIYLLF